MANHTPVVICSTYLKHEMDDNCFHRKTRSLSIRCDIMETAEAVQIEIKHRNVRLTLDKGELKKKSKVLTFNKEPKYYCPVEEWKVISGDTNWYKEIEWEKL